MNILKVIFNFKRKHLIRHKNKVTLFCPLEIAQKRRDFLFLFNPVSQVVTVDPGALIFFLTAKAKPNKATVHGYTGKSHHTQSGLITSQEVQKAFLIQKS